ncbi:TetR/AcrR family transcriptional regulator [Nocardioides limicola]|uniref:TetR/AcrR family transcriptional regulator n=1 Tax=Nocardioides limicola TaxID=2803368 RepID=UPI00193BE8DC|nr:TetR/AcrR family transcriptional regulator [Nocardioides sp. DJM-14]
MSNQLSALSQLPRRGVSARQVETVERLLAAGEVELREVGHEAMTMRTVAKRADVSPATAYTYFASKNHLFAELFWRALVDNPAPAAEDSASVVAGVQAVTRHLSSFLAARPEMAAAVTGSLLSHDPDVERLRLRIGAEFVSRFSAALGPLADDAVVDALTLAFSGALLQAGMGLSTYDDLGDRLDVVVATILEGRA